MSSNTKYRALSLAAIMAALALTAGCTHYAPGYDGWTRSTVEKVKRDAQARYTNFQPEDGKLLGVDYLKFDPGAYQRPLQGMDVNIATQCQSPPYVNYRMIGTVALKTSVCLNQQGEVNRIVLDYADRNTADVAEIVDLAQGQIKHKYGSSIPVSLEQRFMTKDQYRAIYFSSSPSRDELIYYNSVLVSDYITSASADWSGSENAQRRRANRFVLDIKLRDYSAIQEQAAARRTEQLKRALNASE